MDDDDDEQWIMDGWTDGQTDDDDGWIDGQTNDEWMMDRWMMMMMMMDG